jgi:hypothetical protein
MAEAKINNPFDARELDVTLSVSDAREHGRAAGVAAAPPGARHRLVGRVAAATARPPRISANKARAAPRLAPPRCRAGAKHRCVARRCRRCRIACSTRRGKARGATSLPAPDSSARLRWLFRASEVWETGGKDIARAFDALARAFATAKRGP